MYIIILKEITKEELIERPHMTSTERQVLPLNQLLEMNEGYMVDY